MASPNQLQRNKKKGASGSQIKKSKVTKGSGASPAQKDRDNLKPRQKLKKKADDRAEYRVFQNRFKIRGEYDKSGKYYEQNSPGGLNDNTYMAKGTTKPGTSTTTKRKKSITGINRPGTNDNRIPTGTNKPGGLIGMTPYQKVVKGFSNASNKIAKLTTRILTGPVLGVGKFVNKSLYEKYLKDRKKLKTLNNKLPTLKRTPLTQNRLEPKPYRQSITRNNKYKK